jgi:integrase
MSVYLPRHKDGSRRGANYLFDFRLKPKGSSKSQRFHGSTSQATLKAAERVEARLKELAKLGQLSNAMTVAEACEKYWDQKMQHVRSAKDQATNLEVVCTYIGPETLLVDITPALVADAALRPARTPQRAYNRTTKSVELTKHKTTPSTVNRQLIQTLRRLLKYSRYTLGVQIDLTQFEWGALQYEEAEERNREIGAAEEVRYWNALRADYHPIVELYLISGRRRSDWVGLLKSKCQLAAGTVRVPIRKKKKQVEMAVTLTEREHEIISDEMAKSPPSCCWVFTCEAQRVGLHHKKGDRMAITATGLRQAHGTALKRSGITDFRIHDFRHTMATRLLRETGNPKLVQMNLDHASLASTARYMHVLDREVTDARAKVTTYRTGPEVAMFPNKKGANGG